MKALALLLLLLPGSVAAAGSRIVESSMGGDLRVEEAPNGAVLRTMGGDIRVRRAGAEVVAKTMGGNIRVNRLEGSLDAGTMGGNVEVEVVGGGSGRNIEVQSLGGSIEVTLPANFSATFEVELEQDDDGPPNRIESDFPLQIKETSKRRLFQGRTLILTGTGTNGSGANRVRITTIGGDIRIRRK